MFELGYHIKTCSWRISKMDSCFVALLWFWDMVMYYNGIFSWKSCFENLLTVSDHTRVFRHSEYIQPHCLLGTRLRLQGTTSRLLGTTLRLLGTTLSFLGTTLRFLGTRLRLRGTRLRLLGTTLRFLGTRLRLRGTTKHKIIQLELWKSWRNTSPTTRTLRLENNWFSGSPNLWFLSLDQKFLTFWKWIIVSSRLRYTLFAEGFTAETLSSTYNQ